MERIDSCIGGQVRPDVRQPELEDVIERINTLEFEWQETGKRLDALADRLFGREPSEVCAGPSVAPFENSGDLHRLRMCVNGLGVTSNYIRDAVRRLERL